MNNQKKVAAIHDVSYFGRCSITVALPILSAAGFDTSVLPTTILSTHTGGFEGFRYRDLTEEIVPNSHDWQSRNLQFDALYSGFLGSYKQLDLVADLFDTFKSEETLIMVDPILAINGVLSSVYSPEMAKGMLKLCSKADIITPNLTEAALLLDEEYIEKNYSHDYIEKTLKSLSSLGAKKVVLSGVSFGEEKLGVATFDSDTGKISYAFSEQIDGYLHGTDVLGSALLSALLYDFPLDEATQIAVDYTSMCISSTLKAEREIKYGVHFKNAAPYLINRLGLS